MFLAGEVQHSIAVATMVLVNHRTSLTQGEVEQAMAMYQELHRWEDAIAVAEARVSMCNLE